MAPKLVVITEPTVILDLETLARPLVESSGHLNTRWLEEEKWVAVPVESASHLDDHDAELLSEALRAAGITMCFAVATENLLNFPHCLSLEATK
jgi:hypothetical protein